MFFEEDPAPESLDPLFDKLPEKQLKYVGKTRKLIKMEHAYVTSKENGGIFCLTHTLFNSLFIWNLN